MYLGRDDSSFQSAPPARAATPSVDGYSGVAVRFQSAPPARAATRPPRPERVRISIRFQSAPPARAATWAFSIGLRAEIKFQSAPPARAATHRCCRSGGECPVSIRAARAGGDEIKRTTARAWRRMFQSAPPARAATVRPARLAPPGMFQSAPPARAATRSGWRKSTPRGSFNPRRPRGRRHEQRPAGRRSAPRFNPRRPRGRRRPLVQRSPGVQPVSIRAARAGGDV